MFDICFTNKNKLQNNISNVRSAFVKNHIYIGISMKELKLELSLHGGNTSEPNIFILLSNILTLFSIYS